MKFIFLMKGEQYWISLKDNINEALKDYYNYFISNNDKIFCVLVDSGKLSIGELIDYINDSFSSYDDEIDRIFVLGDQLYKGE